MWKLYAVDILYFMKNFEFLVIFWTLLSEKWPFYDNFYEIGFWLIHNMDFFENCP